MKRGISLLTVLCLLVGLCGTIFASAADLVDTVNITGVVAPVAGQAPATNGIVCDVDGVHVEASWMVYNYTNEGFEDVQTFAENKLYKLDLLLTADAPAFHHETAFTVNGEAAENVEVWGEDRVAIQMYYAEGLTPITSLDITGICDTSIGSVMTTQGLQAENAHVNAYWSFNGMYEEGVSIFADGDIYTLDTYVFPNEGYYFAQDMVITFQGQPCDVSWNQNAVHANVGYQVRYVKDDIWNVELTNTLPEEIAAGAAPEVDVSVVYGDAEVTDVYWTDSQYNKVSTLEDGKFYYLAVELAAGEGYRFVDDTSVYAGDWHKTPSTREFTDDTYIAYFYYSLLPVAEKVDLTIKGVEVGKNIADVTVQVQGVEADVAVEIYDSETYDLLTDGIFQDGKGYVISVVLDSEGAYEFDYQTQLTLNGEEYYNFGTWDTTLNLEYYASFKKKIDKVELTVTEPAVGEEPGEVKAPEGANYNLYYYWMDFLTWDELQPGEQFQDGIRYRLEISLEAKEGYDFTEDVKVTINGKDPEDYYVDNYRFAHVEIRNSWSFADSIDKVELPEAPETIQVGAAPQIDPVDTDTYTVTATWMEMNTGDVVTAFEDGKIYMLYMILETKEGYEITDETKKFIGDKEYAGLWEHNYSNAYAVKVYPLGLNIIDKVELTVTEPTLGGTPAAPTIPQDAKYELMEQDFWFENTTGNIFDETDPTKAFTTGKYYFLSAVLTAKEGYAFDDNTKFFINGKEVEPSVYWALGTDSTTAFRYQPLVENQSPSNPQTGDAFPMAAVILLMVLAATGMALVVVGKRRFSR